MGIKKQQVKNEVYKIGYRRRSCTSKTAKIHRFVRFVMYCIITTCSVECCWHCSDGTVHYKSDKTVNSCGCRCATTSPITVFINFVFTALHGMQTRSSDQNSVRLSVSLSNACFVTKWKKDRSRFLYHAKDHLAWFSEEKNGWWGATPSTGNFGSTDPR